MLVGYMRVSTTEQNQLRADGFDVRAEDVARLSPLGFDPINMLGRYAFILPRPPIPSGQAACGMAAASTSSTTSGLLANHQQQDARCGFRLSAPCSHSALSRARAQTGVPVDAVMGLHRG